MVLTASETRKQARESLKGKWGTVAIISLIFIAYSFLMGFLSAIPFLGFLVSITSIVINFPIMYGFVMNFMKLKRGEEVGYFDFFKDGFANFGRAWSVLGRLLQKMLVPLILLVVAVIIVIVALVGVIASAGLAIASMGAYVSSETALSYLLSNVSVFSLVAMLIAVILEFIAYIWIIIKSFHYGLGMYIAIDNQNATALECMNQSKEVMDGHKGRLFSLYLSFIGWILLDMLLAAIPVVGVILSYAGLVFLIPYMQFASIIFYEDRMGINSPVTAEGTVASEDSESNSNENVESKEIKEMSGSTDVKAEIVDIPEIDNKDE